MPTPTTENLIEAKVEEFDKLWCEATSAKPFTPKTWLRQALTDTYDEAWHARGAVESEQKQRMFEAGKSLQKEMDKNVLEGLRKHTYSRTISRQILDEAIEKL